MVFLKTMCLCKFSFSTSNTSGLKVMGLLSQAFEHIYPEILL